MKYIGKYLSAEILLTRTFIETNSLYERRDIKWIHTII